MRYKEAVAVVEEVKAGIKGRICDEQDSVAIMAIYALEAGHGDHLEIGTLFGGSAIVVALLKSRHGLDGKVYCVDPLNGYYYTRSGRRIDKISGLRVDRATLDYNAWQFGVEDRIEVIEKHSIPWPDELKDNKFVSAYIDGDHWKNAPMEDWENVKDRVSRFVVFDNYDNGHKDVMRACEHAAADPGWLPCHQQGITFVLERANNADN
jgi:hypothetical protein